MRIGLYFGSFNPVHQGHLIIASAVANLKVTDQVWFVVSPQNPLKPSKSLINEYDRLHLVSLAISDDQRFKASDIEFKLPRPSFTIDTLAYLQEKYPTYEFYVIMGSDSYQNIHNWKNADVIVRDFKLIIYQRPGFLIKPESLQHVLMESPLLDISATYIRQAVRENKSIRYLVPDKVLEEIKSNRYFL